MTARDPAELDRLIRREGVALRRLVGDVQDLSARLYRKVADATSCFDGLANLIRATEEAKRKSSSEWRGEQGANAPRPLPFAGLPTSQGTSPMTDAEKLRDLAGWFEVRTGWFDVLTDKEVQCDLRRIADRLDAADEFGAAMEAYMRDESTLSWNLDGWWGTPVDSSAVVGPCPSKKEAILAIYRWQMRDDARHHHGPDNR